MVSDPKNADSDIVTRIFIKGFPIRETTENDLTTFFESYGIVKYVNIVKDHKSGLAKYGFVTFDSKEVQETLILKKSVKFQEKNICIGRAERNKRSPEKNTNGAPHEFRRHCPTRQSPHEYTSSTAPMAYYVYPCYNQNAVYMPAMQASTVAQMSSPNYQSSYIPSSPQVFTTLMPGNTATSFVQSMGSDQFLVPMPRTNYVDGYTDYTTIPSIITVPFSPSNDWASVSSSSEGSMNAFQKETQCLPTSPSVAKGKKPFTYSVKEDDETKTSDTSHVPLAAVMPTTKEIAQCLSASPSVAKGKKSFTYSVKEDDETETSDTSHVPVAAVIPTTKEIVS